MWFASLGAMLGYWALVGLADPTWFDQQHVVAPIEQLMTLASLALTGIVVGQVVRRGRVLAEDYAHRQNATLQTGAPA